MYFLSNSRPNVKTEIITQCQETTITPSTEVARAFEQCMTNLNERTKQLFEVQENMANCKIKNTEILIDSCKQCNSSYGY